MTATVTIEVARRDDVLRVPNAALRFRPTNDIFAALKQEVPPEMQRGGRGAGAPGGPGGQRAADPVVRRPVVRRLGRRHRVSRPRHRRVTRRSSKHPVRTGAGSGAIRQRRAGAIPPRKVKAVAAVVDVGTARR